MDGSIYHLAVAEVHGHPPDGEMYWSASVIGSEQWGQAAPLASVTKRPAPP